ncbi:hypothetical protein D3C80_1189040 [compost metagenome]
MAISAAQGLVTLPCGRLAMFLQVPVQKGFSCKSGEPGNAAAFPSVSEALLSVIASGDPITRTGDAKLLQQAMSGPRAAP